MNSEPQEAIAIIGLAGRFPQAKNLQEFWQNLRAGKECISFFKDDQVEWLPIEHPPRLTDPNYVKARAVLDRPEWFDAAFFHMNPKEAEVMDPQHRVFLECAWEALENAGCNPETYQGMIGVFAGASMNTYLFTNLLTNKGLVEDFGLFSSMIMNDGDFVPTRVSYKFNLRGPSINVQTACSTSLVAVCLACQNLLSYRCDVALAGGVSITFPPHRGQHHQEGGILSPDGHCRTFDAQAAGTVLGDGAGVVVLKRLSEAIADGDNICAVIKGTAINNDGSVKIGYTAPSSDGQAEAIALAQAEAQIEPETISYIEAHGTGTPLGDPIEIEGLTKAFGAKPGKKQFCAIGSVKSNIGHLDIAAGVAGLIKTVLALQHGEIPPSLHFERPNPKIDFANSPFFVNAALRPWPANGTPRRAGVSSFGIGGTNAHAVLEEAPALEPSAAAKPGQLLVLSARTATALDAATDNLAAHLQANPKANLADVACTLQTGRKVFAHRRAVVADDVPGAIAALTSRDAKRTVTGNTDAAAPAVAFLFPGQGAQGINMARELYDADPAFRADVDRCCEILRPLVNADLREIIYPAEKAEEAAKLLTQTRITQPALFVIEYALARRWLEWGIKPQAMLGHSLGEYVAACLAGVFTLEDALALVAERARLMQAQPAGAMLAVRLAEAQVRPLLGENLALAAVNAPGLSVVSGPFDAIDALEQRLAASAIPSKRLATSHAFHSAMMEPALRPLADFIRTRRMVLSPPKIRWVSNVTGDWITPAQATDPEYWTKHIRNTVRFADGVAKLVEAGPVVLLEVGPGQTLAGLARQHPNVSGRAAAIVASLGRGTEATDARTNLLRALGELWIAGAAIDWRRGVHRGERRTVVPLPTYPFERKRHWIEPAAGSISGVRASMAAQAIESPPSAVDSTAKAAAPSSNGANGSAAHGTIGVLRKLLQDLSGLDLAQASETATFYELGFDSLFLTQASRAVASRFGCEVTFRQLREDFCTLAKLGAFLDARSGNKPAVTAEAPKETAAPVAEKRIPLTASQREMWFASQLGGAMSAAYNECSILKFTGPVDRDALGRAMRQLAQRHESLRTRFEALGDLQVIAPTASGELQFHDLSSRPATERDAAAAQWIDQELRQHFDLVQGPAWKITLLKVDETSHLLALVAHHIVCDGWSLGVLIRELGELYSAETEHRQPTLAPAPSFADYVSQDPEKSAAWVSAENFWKEQFADSVPTLELPTDRSRPVERTYAAGFVLRTLSPEVAAGLKRLCAERQCTPFTALFAAFSLLVHKLSQQDDVVVGVPSTAQVMDGQERLVGHFANVLAVRSRWQADQTAGEFITTLGQQLNQALEHWRYPFARLVQALNLPRDSSRVPLAPVIFNTTRRRGVQRFAGLTAEVVSNPKPFVNFDLNFNFALIDDAITLGCYYSSELYDEATIARWFSHFEVLLRAFVAQPATKIGDLPLLTDAERQQIVYDWNSNQLEYDRNGSIYDLFQAQVRKTPDAIAVVGESERLTYAELARRVDRIAATVRAAGIGPDSLVGIFLGRSPNLVAAIYGVLKAGGAYVPLEPSYPSERLEFITKDTGLKVLVTEQAMLTRLPEGDFEIISIDDELAVAASVRRASGQQPAKVTASNLAYVIYTSGSTGRPKGAMLEQHCVTALVAWAKQLYTPAELSGVLFSTSAAFDISVFELFCPLCLGGKIIVAENILQLGTHPARNEVTFLSGVPSALTEVVRAKIIPPSVTTVALAGELFPQPLVEALYALPHMKRVFELYGPTEATVYSTGSLRKTNSSPTLGLPFPNEQIYILDSRLRPVPIGVTGEIYIGGDKLARGYLNRPELTAEKFIPSPFVPGQRIYRSGDIGRFRPDGFIESLGRSDHQVKIRGFRVELGEVETALSQVAPATESVVLARPDPSGNQRLIAYLVPRPGAVIDARALRTELQQRLPDYMVPSAFVALEKFPLTSNGKLDRRALPDPEFESAAAASAAPRNSTEELLAEVWREVLGLKQVGIHDNFFELGGHSLLATQVIARVNESLGLEITLGQFFVAPTIAGLAPAVEAALIEQIVTPAPGERETAVLTANHG